MAVHHDLPGEIVIEFGLEFIESTLEILQWNEFGAVESADVPLQMGAHIKHDGARRVALSLQRIELTRRGFVFATKGVTERNSSIVKSAHSTALAAVQRAHAFGQRNVVVGGT